MCYLCLKKRPRDDGKFIYILSDMLAINFYITIIHHSGNVLVTFMCRSIYCFFSHHSDNVLVALMYRFIYCFFFMDFWKYSFLGIMCPIISRKICSGASKSYVLQKSLVNLVELETRLRAGISRRALYVHQ